MTEEREYAGDVVYDDFLDGKCRAEIVEFLADLCSRFFLGRYQKDSERLSEGPAIDTILLLLDIAVKPEEIRDFRECLRKQITESEEDSEDVNPQSEEAD